MANFVSIPTLVLSDASECHFKRLPASGFHGFSFIAHWILYSQHILWFLLLNGV